MHNCVFNWLNRVYQMRAPKYFVSFIPQFQLIQKRKMIINYHEIIIWVQLFRYIEWKRLNQVYSTFIFYRIDMKWVRSLRKWIPDITCNFALHSHMHLELNEIVIKIKTKHLKVEDWTIFFPHILKRQINTINHNRNQTLDLID